MPSRYRRVDGSVGMHVVRVLGKLEPGGAQLALLRLSRELRRRHGVRTTLVVGDAGPAGLALARRYGVETVAYRTPAEVHPSENLQWQLSADFARWLRPTLATADLVHAHMVGAWWAAAQVVPPGTPLVATEHNEVGWSARRVRTLRAVTPRIDRFFAMGPAARAFATAAGVTAPVLRDSRSPVAGLSAVARPGLVSPRITFAGRMCVDKGPDVLVEALVLLDSPVMAYLLGDGPLRPALLRRVAGQSLADRVVLPGWVDAPWTFVAGSTVHVVPSREEAWSQSAVLGLGLGATVIGTRVDGLTGTLAQRRGVLVAPDDPAALATAIQQTLQGETEVDRAGALSYARRFTPSRVADFYLGEYRQLLATAAVRSEPAMSAATTSRV